MGHLLLGNVGESIISNAQPKKEGGKEGNIDEEK